MDLKVFSFSILKRSNKKVVRADLFARPRAISAPLSAKNLAPTALHKSLTKVFQAGPLPGARD